MAYRDSRGYERQGKGHSDLIHRHRAYYHIYLKNRKKYPLPFEEYEVHHIDGDKTNNRMDNLAVLTPEEHDKAHEELDRRRKELYEEEKGKKAEEERKTTLFNILTWTIFLLLLVGYLFGSVLCFILAILFIPSYFLFRWITSRSV